MHAKLGPLAIDRERHPIMAMCEFKVVGMRDEQCLRLVMNAIQDLPGIAYAEVSLETGEASVEHGAFISEADVRAAVEDAGFETR